MSQLIRRAAYELKTISTIRNRDDSKMDSSFAHYIHDAFHHDADWRYRFSEQLEAAMYLGMQAFVLFMAAFFFLFVYYCTFGFVVGAIAESNTEDPPVDQKQKAITAS